MASEMCIAIYRAKPGKEEDLIGLIRGHVPLLQGEGLATDRDAVVLRSQGRGMFLEVFEWAAEDAAHKAHTHPKVGPYWGRMAEVADFLTLADAPEATSMFPHFKALT